MTLFFTKKKLLEIKIKFIYVTFFNYNYRQNILV